MKRRCLPLQPFHIPKSCRQPRSQGPRAPPPRGSLYELPSSKDGSSSSTTASTDDSSHAPVSTLEEMTGSLIVRCSMSLNVGLGGTILPPAEVKPVTKNTNLDACNNGLSMSSETPSESELRIHILCSNTGQHNNDLLCSHSTAEPLPFTHAKSILKATGSADARLAPGSVIWARIGDHEWWPAEVMDERAALECTNYQCDGLVLVRLYGIYEYAWVDPMRDLSQFDYCYEERSKNPLKAFQDALKQAIHRKELTSPSELSDKSSDKWNMSSSSRTNDDYIDGGRGKRKQKAKVHFDDLTFPEKSARRVRRMRIMRYLGLTAPVGSPFSRPHYKL